MSTLYIDREDGQAALSISASDFARSAQCGYDLRQLWTGDRNRQPRRAHPSYTDNDVLLLVILDDIRRANFRFVRIKPDVTKGTPLAQEIPALIQFDPDLGEPFSISFGMRPELVQSMLFLDQALDVIEDRLIFDLILHENLLRHGYDRNGHIVMLRPAETSVNRCLAGLMTGTTGPGLAITEEWLTSPWIVGTLSDYWGKRKGLAVFGYALGAFTKPFFALTSGIGHALTVRLLDRAGKGVRGGTDRAHPVPAEI